MKKQALGCFTLIKVVLAISIGLITIMVLLIRYRDVKREAIVKDQRLNVAAIKVWVEQAIASTRAKAAFGSISLVPPRITNAQMTILANRLPSLKIDPYLGSERKHCTNNGFGGCSNCVAFGAGSCYFADRPQDGFPLSRGSFTASGLYAGLGSTLIYTPGETFKGQFEITLDDRDRSVRTFYGYVITETDIDGNVIAAEGGDITTSQISPKK